jgi:phosphate-selective porin OprO/OprP
VRIAETDRFDFSMRAWYAQMLIMLTGERPVIKGGVLEKIRPLKDFNIRTGAWGAWGLAFMYQDFEAEDEVYDFLVTAGDSIRKADSFTVGLNWYLNSMVRLTLNYSRTRFDDPLFLGSHPTKGYAYYQDIEHAWVTRFQLEF